MVRQRDGDKRIVWSAVALAALMAGIAYAFGIDYASSAGCPSVAITQGFTFVYGDVTVDATPVPPGTVVEARSPRGVTVGCQVVARPGAYDLMYVYGEETVEGTTIPGMRTGETIQFRVAGLAATPVPVLTWSGDWSSHDVALKAYGSLPQSTSIFLPLVTR
jgi:hypothetical protein